MKTIYILWLRQVKKYLRSRSRLIGSLGQPLLFLFALGFGFGSTYKQANGGDYIRFLVPGIVAMSVLFTAMFNGIELLWDRQFGFLKETMAAPVARWQIMLGRTLGGATVATIQGVIVFAISYATGFRPDNLMMLPAALFFIFITALLFTSLGTAIASMIEDMQGFHLIINFLIMPLFFLSGAIFPLKGLPKIMEVITRFNPLTYGVDGIRGTLINANVINLGFDMLVLVVLTVVVVSAGSILFERIQV